MPTIKSSDALGATQEAVRPIRVVVVPSNRPGRVDAGGECVDRTRWVETSYAAVGSAQEAVRPVRFIAEPRDCTLGIDGYGDAPKCAGRVDGGEAAVGIA